MIDQKFKAINTLLKCKYKMELSESELEEIVKICQKITLKDNQYSRFQQFERFIKNNPQDSIKLLLDSELIPYEKARGLIYICGIHGGEYSIGIIPVNVFEQFWILSEIKSNGVVFDSANDDQYFKVMKKVNERQVSETEK